MPLKNMHGPTCLRSAGFPPAHGMAYDPQQAQQAALPASSTTASSVPAGGAGEGGPGGAAGGPRRQLNHEAGPLQEFLRLHAAFNGNRAASIRVRGPAGCPACPAAFLLPGMRWHARWAGL